MAPRHGRATPGPRRPARRRFVRPRREACRARTPGTMGDRAASEDARSGGLSPRARRSDCSADAGPERTSGPLWRASGATGRAAARDTPARVFYRATGARGGGVRGPVREGTPGQKTAALCRFFAPTDCGSPGRWRSRARTHLARARAPHAPLALRDRGAMPRAEMARCREARARSARRMLVRARLCIRASRARPMRLGSWPRSGHRAASSPSGLPLVAGRRPEHRTAA